MDKLKENISLIIMWGVFLSLSLTSVITIVMLGVDIYYNESSISLK